MVLIVLLVAAGVWYVISRQPDGTHPSVVDLPEVSPVTDEPVAEFPVEEIQPRAESVPEPEPLPSLGESDPVMIEALAGLVGPESLDAYFVMERVASRIVATIDSLTGREIAPLVLPLKPAEGNFMALGTGDELVINPENDVRYAPYTSMVATVDTGQAVAIYVRYYPLFQDAYKALGYPSAYFNDRLVEVIDHLLETPEVSGPVALVKPEAVYLYEDEALEALSAGQKIMIRIGPENAAVIRGKLREIRLAITRQSL